MFMSEEEIKSLTDLQREIKQQPKPFDFSKAEPVHINKDEMKVQEIQAEQEKLSQFI